MSKSLISGNLNLYGNAGQFETDRSTWGFSDSSDFVITRSSVLAHAGLYSALLTDPVGGISNQAMMPCSWYGTIGKKYVIRAMIYSPSSNPLGAGSEKFNFRPSLSNFLFGLTEIDYIEKTITEATDTWVQIEISVLADGAPLSTTYGLSLCGLVSGNAGGKLYVDEFEVYEYIDVDDGGDPDPEPEPDETDSAFLSKNPITLGKAATAGWELLDNYRLYNDVRVEDEADSSAYNSKLKVALYPNSDGNVVFYLNEAFRDAFTFVPPTLNQSTIIRLTDRIKRFKNYSGELVDLNVIPGSLTEGNANLVLFGGIDKFHFPGLNYLTSYLPANKKFLTWAPLEKYVDRLQEDYLNFWIYDETIASLQLQIKAYFDDDTDETAIATEFVGCVFRSLYQVPVGPVNSGASLVNPAKNLVKYEITLLDQDDVAISETRIYYIAQVRHPLTRFFMFLNSLGSFEVLMFTGQASEETSFERDVVQKFLPHDYAAVDGEFAVNNNVMNNKNSYSSGYIKNRLSAEWHEYMKDFLLSSRIYDVTTGKRIPFVITGGTHLKEDQNYQRFIRFEGKPAYDNQSFTPASI